MLTFTSKKAFLLSGFFATSFLLSAPLNGFAENLTLAGAPHASDIKPEIAKKATKATPDKELKNNLNDARTQVKEAESSLELAQSNHKKGQASADEVSTHIQMLSDNIDTLNSRIKDIKAAPKSAAHTRWIHEGNFTKVMALKTLNNAKQTQQN